MLPSVLDNSEGDIIARGLESQVQIPLCHTGCVALVKLLNLSEPLT